MEELRDPSFSTRQTAAAEAKKALLAKFKPKPHVPAENFQSRHLEKEAELERVRAERAAAKEAARVEAEQAKVAEQDRLANDEEAQLAMKRNERKERKAAAKAEARTKREMKSSQRR